MKKLPHIGFIEAICLVNLVALMYMLFATSYAAGFTEERAVIGSFIWMFTVILALPIAIYGIVDTNKHPKSKRRQLTRLVICWLTVVANAAAILSVFSPFW